MNKSIFARLIASKETACRPFFKQLEILPLKSQYIYIYIPSSYLLLSIRSILHQISLDIMYKPDNVTTFTSPPLL
jgi:hypothetical protein